MLLIVNTSFARLAADDRLSLGNQGKETAAHITRFQVTS